MFKSALVIIKDKIMKLIMLIIVCLPMIIGIISLILFGVWIYAMVVYGDTPLSEAPVWVYWILTAGRK